MEGSPSTWSSAELAEPVRLQAIAELAARNGLRLSDEDLARTAANLHQRSTAVAPMLKAAVVGECAKSMEPGPAEAAMSAAPPGGAGMSAEDTIRRALAVIEATENDVHAYVEINDRAVDEARAVDARHEPGALDGVPFGVKDVLAVAGMQLECGCRALRGQRSAWDASAVAQLRQAGAVCLGKQATHELTVGLDQPSTRNPWDLARYPGGSSAGAGVSVATGSVRFALGTDAAGSVRIPAAATGTVGLKPTWGGFPTGGLSRRATAPTVDHVGIVAADVSIARRVTSVLCPAVSAATRLSGACGGRPLEGVGIGVLGDVTAASIDRVAPAVQAAFDHAKACLAELGARVVPVEIGSFGLARSAVFTIFGAEIAAANLDLVNDHRAELHDGVRELIQLAAVLPDTHWAAALRVRTQLRTELQAAFAEHHLSALLTPTMPDVAPRLDEFDPSVDIAGLIVFTCPFNLTGQPAVTVPYGTANGMPIGLQLVGEPHREDMLLDVAAALEGSCPPTTVLMPRP